MYCELDQELWGANLESRVFVYDAFWLTELCSSVRGSPQSLKINFKILSSFCDFRPNSVRTQKRISFLKEILQAFYKQI